MSTLASAWPLRAAVANARLALARARLSSLLAKANFNPNQPRVPAGTREGGRWVRPGADAPHVSLHLISEQATHLGLAAGRSSLIKFGAVLVPRERPVTLREANRTAWDIAKELIKFGARSTAIGRLVELASDAVWL